jgi:hypothetical protein
VKISPSFATGSLIYQKKSSRGISSTAAFLRCRYQPLPHLLGRPRLYWNVLKFLMKLPLRFEYSSTASK